jgi:hypothetical protein
MQTSSESQKIYFNFNWKPGLVLNISRMNYISVKNLTQKKHYVGVHIVMTVIFSRSESGAETRSQTFPSPLFLHRLKWFRKTGLFFIFNTLISIRKWLYIYTCLMSISRFSLRDKVTLRLLKLHFYGADVVEWLRALNIMQEIIIQSQEIKYIMQTSKQVTTI